jgi:seryl-tRNA synthetase
MAQQQQNEAAELKSKIKQMTEEAKHHQQSEEKLNEVSSHVSAILSDVAQQQIEVSFNSENYQQQLRDFTEKVEELNFLPTSKMFSELQQPNRQFVMNSVK